MFGLSDAQKKAADRVRKLLEKTEANGCTAEEALLAMETAQKILIAHELEMSDVEKLDVGGGEEVDHEMFDPQEHGLPFEGRMAWTEMLARIVSRAHGCEFLVFDNRANVLFIGRPLNRRLAIYLFGFLVRTARRLADQAWSATLDEFADLQRDFEARETAQKAAQVYVPDMTDIDRLIVEITARMNPPAERPVLPEEARFRSSFLISFVIAVEQRFNARAAKAGALVPSAVAAKTWVEDREREGSVKSDDTNAPPLPAQHEIDRSGSLAGYYSGTQVSIDANALEGETWRGAAPAISEALRRLQQGVPPAIIEAELHRDNRVRRMAMSLFSPHGVLPRGQVVIVESNGDGTYRVFPEANPDFVIPCVTPEYLEDFR